MFKNKVGCALNNLFQCLCALKLKSILANQEFHNVEQNVKYGVAFNELKIDYRFMSKFKPKCCNQTNSYAMPKRYSFKLSYSFTTSLPIQHLVCSDFLGRWKTNLFLTFGVSLWNQIIFHHFFIILKEIYNNIKHDLI